VYTTLKKIRLFLSKECLDRKLTFFRFFVHTYTPDFFVAEHYGLRKTLPPGGLRISPHRSIKICEDSEIVYASLS
jgi:hypothetical protein